MDIVTAVDVIESVAGITDESTSAGEAWAVVLSYIEKPRPTDAELAALLRELAAAVEQCYPYAPYAHKPTRSTQLITRARAMAEQLHPVQEET
jgi:hypothetical protein